MIDSPFTSSVAFVCQPSAAWTGGETFYRHMFVAIRSVRARGDMREIVLFVPGDPESFSPKHLEPLVDRLLVAPPAAASNRLLSGGAAIEWSVGLVKAFGHSLLGIIREATAAV